MRVSVALLHEPLRLHEEAAQESPSLRVSKLDEIVRFDSKLHVLKVLRKSVFHDPRGNLDTDGRDEQFDSLLNLCGECTDPE